MVNISERPAAADDRAVPGFWEAALIIDKGGKSQIATLVERTSRFTMLVKIPYDRCAERVAALLARKMETLPEFMRNSLTWDQGKEDDPPRRFHRPHRPARLLLRPALAVAAGQQREHCESGDGPGGLVRQGGAGSEG